MHLDQRTTHARPDAWADEITAAEVEVLPLANDTASGIWPGWCSYASRLQSPDVEILAGGINTKNPEAAGLWRQGHLLHFGFEPSPDQLNENGRALLLNSIAYIARFHEDQALIREPSPFAGGGSEARAVTEADEEFLGCKLEDEHFPAHCLDRLQSEDSQVARRAADLISRAVRGGSSEWDVAAWIEWLTEREQALFFSPSSGDRWCVDDLALKRGVPSAELRGPDRADLGTSTSTGATPAQVVDEGGAP